MRAEKGKVNPEEVAEMVSDIGYDAKVVEVEEITIQESVTTSSSNSSSSDGKEEEMLKTKEHILFHIKPIRDEDESKEAKEEDEEYQEMLISEIQTRLLGLPFSSSSPPQLTALPLSSTISCKIQYNPQEVGHRDVFYLLQSLLQSNQNEDEEEGDQGQTGFEVTLPPIQSSAQSLEERNQREVKRTLHRFLSSLMFALPLLIISMVIGNTSWGHMGLMMEVGEGVSLMGLLLLILATPVQFWSGYPFYKGARKSFKTKVFGMDFLIATGTSAAYLYSLISFILGIVNKEPNEGTHFFETSSTLIAVVLFGKYLEAMAKGRTSQALSKLADLKASHARLLFQDEEDGSEREELIPSELIQVGDLLRLVTGEKVPTDGELVGGSVCVDESMITGESVPVTKSLEKGGITRMVGGTIIVQGSGLMKVSGIGGDTALGRIVSLVEQAQTTKPPIQEFAEKISSIFVPIVAAISIVTTLTWIILCGTNVVPDEWYEKMFDHWVIFSFLFGLSVWVIACPCALGLATPTAVMVGTGVAAQMGIFIKTGVALQSAASINTIVFDKTGTLTTGRPVVTDLLRTKKHQLQSNEEESKEKPNSSIPYSSNEEVSHSLLLHYLWNAERRSTHPLALAIKEYTEIRLQSLGVSLDTELIQEDTYEVVTGKGIICHSSDGNHTLHIGSKSFMTKVCNIEINDHLERQCTTMRSGGKVVIFVAVNMRLEAIVGVADAIRPEAAFTIYKLHKMGIETFMLTGDHEATALAVGMALGIMKENIIANCLPEDKAKHIMRLQNSSIDDEYQKDSQIETKTPPDNKKRVVGFIGDGINDSPALSQSDVGFAVGGGTEVATESSDVLLGKDSIFDVVKAIDLSKTVFNRIKLNYVWALGFNSIGIPVASGVFFPLVQMMLPPMLAGVIMAVSSVCVVLSSLALNLYTPPKEYVNPKEEEKFDPNYSPSDDDGEFCKCPVSNIVEIQERSFFDSFTAIGAIISSQRDGGDEDNKMIGGCGCGAKNCKCIVDCHCTDHLEMAIL